MDVLLKGHRISAKGESQSLCCMMEKTKSLDVTSWLLMVGDWQMILHNSQINPGVKNLVNKGLSIFIFNYVEGALCAEEQTVTREKRQLDVGVPRHGCCV